MVAIAYIPPGITNHSNGAYVSGGYKNYAGILPLRFHDADQLMRDWIAKSLEHEREFQKANVDFPEQMHALDMMALCIRHAKTIGYFLQEQSDGTLYVV